MPGEERERTAGGDEEACRREECEATMIVPRQPANWCSSNGAAATPPIVACWKRPAAVSERRNVRRTSKIMMPTGSVVIASIA